MRKRILNKSFNLKLIKDEKGLIVEGLLVFILIASVITSVIFFLNRQVDQDIIYKQSVYDLERASLFSEINVLNLRSDGSQELKTDFEILNTLKLHSDIATFRSIVNLPFCIALLRASLVENTISIRRLTNLDRGCSNLLSLVPNCAEEKIRDLYNRNSFDTQYFVMSFYINNSLPFENTCGVARGSAKDILPPPFTDPSFVPPPTPSVTPPPPPTPTVEPSDEPTSEPSKTPSPSETPEPSISEVPSESPYESPSETVSEEPSSTPSVEPSFEPSNEPSIEPSESSKPTPSATPSIEESPSLVPTETVEPTPSIAPSETTQPTEMPTETPNRTPNITPVPTESVVPTLAESPIPTNTVTPSLRPTETPKTSNTPNVSATPVETKTITPPSATPVITNTPIVNNTPILKAPELINRNIL